MLHEDLYKNFAEDCYNQGKDLDEAIRDEIKGIIYNYSTSTIMDTPQVRENAINNTVDKIMKLMYETRYEW